MEPSFVKLLLAELVGGLEYAVWWATIDTPIWGAGVQHVWPLVVQPGQENVDCLQGWPGSSLLQVAQLGDVDI